MKIVLKCRCGNVDGEVNTKCKTCGFYISEQIDCDICGYLHKIRPRSFCTALHSGKINDPDTKEEIVADILARRI